jgi:hypothetical protein
MQLHLKNTVCNYILFELRVRLLEALLISPFEEYVKMFLGELKKRKEEQQSKMYIFRLLLTLWFRQSYLQFVFCVSKRQWVTCDKPCNQTFFKITLRSNLIV